MAIFKTCEFVTPMHPDKVCDRIVDALLDAYLAGDPKSRVALEAMGGHGTLRVTGEVTSAATVDIEAIVRPFVGEGIRVETAVEAQSPEIARGVDVGGAGDQGIMVGYACADTPERMPREYALARSVCRAVYEKYPFDGKAQVTLEGEAVRSVVVSFQHAPKAELEALVRSLVQADAYHINPAGDWSLGGFDADSGLSGRKIVVDAYGPEIPVGGGSFSGKDPTKVDRSAAYMARHVALSVLERKGAREVLVKLAYAIGVAEPVMAVAVVDGIEGPIPGDFDLTPQGIRRALNLARPLYAETASWGHFGRGFAWDMPKRV